MDVTKRAHVIALAKQGLGQRAIARQTGYNRSFVERWYRRDSPQDGARSGRPPMLTTRALGKVRALMKVRAFLRPPWFLCSS